MLSVSSNEREALNNYGSSEGLKIGTVMNFEGQNGIQESLDQELEKLAM